LPVNSSKKSKRWENPLIFTPATAADLDALMEIEGRSFPSPWSRQFFQAELEKPYATVLVARTPTPGNENILGYIVFWLLFDELHILNLAVCPSCRRRGIATRLLEEVLHQARAHGCRIAWLEVRSSNLPALSLYSSLGFRQIGVRKGYYHDTGEDALIFSCQL